MHFTKLLFLNFIRVKVYTVAILVLWIAGMISLHIGKTFIDNHQKNIQKTALAQQNAIDRYVKFENKEMGLLLYYLKFGLINELPPLVGLSIGQRDINPSTMSLTIRNLEEQKYNTELHNPMYQLLGNMDFSFVLIYFFPLVIIAFCFNALSEEKESGIWKLICSQTTKPHRIIFQKLAIRFVVIELLLVVILLTAKFYLNIPFDNLLIIFAIAAMLYVLFWFVFCAWIVFLQKNSNQNALLLLVAWVLLTIVLPAGANAIVIRTYPTQEAFKTLLESRDGYHKKWDLKKEITIQRFKAHYPQLTEFEHPKGKDFSWFWYYAMQQMGDDEVQETIKQFKSKLANREKMSQGIAYFLPSIHTQIIFNQIAQSDLENQLQFWEALEQFHEQHRLYFYPKIFRNAPVLKENWQQWKLANHKNKSNINWARILLPILTSIVIHVLLIYVQIVKIKPTL